MAGEGKFNGPLNVQGTLTVGGVARIGGDLSVTGKLTAASFTGNGAGLSNVTLADNSITKHKTGPGCRLTLQSTGGKMVISADRLEVAGYMAVERPIERPRGFYRRVCRGQSHLANLRELACPGKVNVPV